MWKLGEIMAFLAKIFIPSTAWKVFKYGVISGPYFSVFGLNTKIYGVNLRIQSEYKKIRTRNKTVFVWPSQPWLKGSYNNFSRSNDLTMMTSSVALNLRIQSEYRKMRTKNNSVFEQLSRSDPYFKKRPTT